MAQPGHPLLSLHCEEQVEGEHPQGGLHAASEVKLDPLTGRAHLHAHWTLVWACSETSVQAVPDMC